MQSSKNSKNGSSEKPQKSSPVTPQKLKLPASDAESVPSPNRASRTPKDKSPKVLDRRLSRSPANQKKSSSKVSELESQLSHLQEELKKTKDQLTSSELTTKQAQEEAEVAKNELAAMSSKLDSKSAKLDIMSEEPPVEKFEATQNQQHSSDLNNTELELDVTLSLVEKLKCQLSESQKSESRALELLTDTQLTLEMAKTIEENLIAEGVKAEEAYKLLALDLEKLKTRAGENEGPGKLESELLEAKAEVENLKAALAIAERACHDENIQSNLLIRSAHEQAEYMKAELAIREVEMGAELGKAKSEIEKLKAAITAYMEAKNENEIQTELKRLVDENEALKADMERREMEMKRENEEAVALVESFRVSEREALMKVGYLTEEADKSNQKAARVVEQLEAIQGTNAEMEAELRRLKVQSDQWRKAAEAAAAMVSSGYNGKLVERTGSLDKGFNNTIGSKLGSPFSEDLYDDSPKKKNGNMLRKLSVLLKKGQK